MPKFLRPIQSALLYLRIARLHTSLMTVCQGAVFLCRALRTGASDINTACLLCTMGAAWLFNLSANALSEYRDCQNNIDDPLAPGPKYRLVATTTSRYRFQVFAWCIFSAAVISGVVALYLGSFRLLAPGLVGAGVAHQYSEKPLTLKNHGLGEIAVLVIYGPVLAIALSLAAFDSLDFVSMSGLLPGAVLIVGVMLANNIRDRKFDQGKTKTIATVLGDRKATIILASLVGSASILDLVLFKTIMPSLIISAILFTAMYYSKTEKLIEVFGIMVLIQSIFSAIF